MRHAGVPTARFEAFDTEGAALAYLRAHSDYPVVVKADGAAAGKGVTVARSRDEAEEAVRVSFGGKFGAAGERIVIEECLEGREASVFVLTDGHDILPFLPAQDYKRAFDGDEGPNTGGMGSYSPIMWMEPATYAAILEDITGCRMRGDLPEAARDFVGFVEAEVGAPLCMISVGPERDQAIIERIGT